MSAERLNPETTASALQAAQPDAAAGIRGTKESDRSNQAEKKGRKRKRDKRKNQSEAPVSDTHIENSQKERQEPIKILSLDDDTVMLWKRPGSESSTATVLPETRPDDQKPFQLGEKAFAAAAMASEPANEQLKPAGKPVESDAMATAEAVRLPYTAYDQQPQMQHQASEFSGYQPYRPPESEADMASPLPEATHYTETVSGPEDVAVPPLPPDPLTYRRRFWQEQPVAGEDQQVAGRDFLPPIHDYEEMVQTTPVEHTSIARESSLVEGPAPVPRLGRYESPLPPGLQRTPREVSQAAWTGLIAGRWLGRRGKRKAVQRAHDVGLQAGLEQAKQYHPPHLEAEPMHQYVPHETAGRTIVVEPISVETHRPAAPLAAVAAFERVRPRSTAETREVPRAARAAAAKVAEVTIISAERANRAPEAVSGASSERQLGKQELLKIAKDIKVDGVRLKDVYAAKRIDEEGLRAVVDAYLRGGDIRQQLSREVVAKEQSYERDPNLRHQRRTGELASKAGGSQNEKANKVWGQAKGLASEQGSKLKASTQKTAQKASEMIATGAKQAQHDIIDNSNTTDWLSITAVVVLYSIILILLLG